MPRFPHYIPSRHSRPDQRGAVELMRLRPGAWQEPGGPFEDLTNNKPEPKNNEPQQSN